MFAKLSVDHVLMKAKSHEKKGEVREAQKLYQSVLQTYCKEAKDIKQGLVNLNRSKETNFKHSPSHEQLNILLEHYQNKQLVEAEKLAISITQEFPTHQLSWKILGAVLDQSGRNSEALDANQIAVNLSTKDAEAHFNLGNTLQKLGRLDEAEASYVNALSLKPYYAEVYNNLGNMLRILGRLDDSEKNLRQAIAFKPDYVEAHYNLGIMLQEFGRLDESIECLKLVIELNPDFVKGRISLNTVSSSAVLGWHIPMMNDKVRNNAYSSAIKLAVDDGAFVLDIGTGSGLLSLMAAASGAGKIITCETSKTIAKVAKEIVCSNGFEEKISVLNKKSTDLIVGKDLPQKADLIISEVLSAEFVGEGVRTTALDAKQRLLKPGGTMIPQSGKIRISLIGDSPEIFDATTVANVNGFDLSKFNLISKTKVSISLRDKPLLLSAPKDAFNINLCDRSNVLKEEKIINLQANRDGLCLGIIQWLWVHLYKDIEYENKPGENASHWPTPIYLFDQPVTVKAGDVFNIKGVLGEDNVWFYRSS